MGNELGKEENDDLQSETPAAERSNKMSFLDETTNFVNKTIRKLSNPNVVQENETMEGSSNDVKANQGLKDTSMESNGPTTSPDPSVVVNDETVNGTGVLGPVNDKFNSKLKQTVLALNALRGTGDECHAFVVTNERGQRLAGYHWKPRAFKIGGKKVRMPGGPRAVVFILHGAGEHCQWYDVIAKPLNAQGITVCAHDHVGHGMSEGDRVHVESFSDYTRDVVQHLDLIHKKYPESPVFLLGHSMGGTIAIKTLLDYKELPVKGVILIGPAVLPNPESVSPVKIFMAKVAAKLAPQVEVGSIKPEWVCRDPEIVKKYIEDPLVWHGGLKARMASELLDAMDDIAKRLPEFTLPYLLLHGTDDKLCHIPGSDLFDEKTSSPDKTYKKYEGAYHQLHNEPDGVGAQCVQEIIDWVLRHM